jgi:hypothetical protein
LNHPFTPRRGQKKATRRWHFFAEKITSSRQQVQQQELQQQERQVQQQELQQQERQAQQQVLQQQERGLLFYRKRPEQQPTKLPRGVIFSWKFPLSDAKNIARFAATFNQN